MRYFYDTEFIDDGYNIELISIGVVAEDGREYYAVSTEFDPERAGSWVRANVLPKLPPPASQLWRSRARIRADLETFFDVDGSEPIELWAWVGAYDHVALCQLWGPMTASPAADPAIHPRAAPAVGGARTVRGCRAGRPMRTTRWSTPATSCDAVSSDRTRTAGPGRD